MSRNIDRQCNECGTNDWSRVHGESYPTRRQNSQQTQKDVFACGGCGAEGRRFDDGETDETTFSGALR